MPKILHNCYIIYYLCLKWQRQSRPRTGIELPGRLKTWSFVRFPWRSLCFTPRMRFLKWNPNQILGPTYSHIKKKILRFSPLSHPQFEGHLFGKVIIFWGKLITFIGPLSFQVGLCIRYQIHQKNCAKGQTTPPPPPLFWKCQDLESACYCKSSLTLSLKLQNELWAIGQA